MNTRIKNIFALAFIVMAMGISLTGCRRDIRTHENHVDVTEQTTETHIVVE